MNENKYSEIQELAEHAASVVDDFEHLENCCSWYPEIDGSLLDYEEEPTEENAKELWNWLVEAADDLDSMQEDNEETCPLIDKIVDFVHTEKTRLCLK